METFTVVYENADYSAMYRVTVSDGRVRYQLLPGTLVRKTLVHVFGDSEPEIL
jgi:hypothetical protein